MTIRPPRPEDLPHLAAINNAYLGRGTMQLQRVTPESFSIYLPQRADAQHALHVGELEGEVIGYALVKPYSPRAGYRFAGETSVYLRGSHLGQGLGRSLMEAVLLTARQLGFRYLAAKIWTNNAHSIHFHETLGYTIVGVQRGIGWVDGQAIDVTIMEKQLPPPPEG